MSESSPTGVNEFQWMKQEETSSVTCNVGDTDEKHRQSIRLAKGLAAHNMKPLPDGYELGESDVICGRGRKCFNHIGNQRFRKMVEDCLPKYAEATAKLEKTYIICEVVNMVRKNSPNGGFVKKDPVTGRYFEVGDFLAREKTSQAFRDALHDQYKSSNAAKKKRRIQEQAQKLHKQHSAPMLSRSAILQSTNDLAAERNGMMFQPNHNNGYAHDDYAVNNSKWMRVETQHDSMGSSFMGNEANDTRMDLLLGELNLDGGADKRRMFASQKSATSVIEDIHGQTPAWFNRSCPNLQAKPVAEMRSSPLLHEPIQEAGEEDAHMIDEFSSRSSGGRATGGWHHSTPNLFEQPQLDTSAPMNVGSTADQFYSGSLKKARSDRRLSQGTGFHFDLYAEQPEQTQSCNGAAQQVQQQRPLYQEDIVLSPIGDGSTRGLFEKLQGIEETVDEFLDPLPF